MASVVKIKRSSVQGKAPTTSDLEQGEIALNTRDKKLFSSDGSAVFEIGSNVHSISVGTGGLVIANGAITFPTSDGSADQALVTDGSGNLSFAKPVSDYDRDGFTQAIHYDTGKITRNNIDFGNLDSYTVDPFNTEDTSWPQYECNEPLGRTVNLDFGEIS